ncbi:MAG: hypothetical protein ACRDY7_14755 [Acidimicrobiia bacterium]
MRTGRMSGRLRRAGAVALNVALTAMLATGMTVPAGAASTRLDSAFGDDGKVVVDPPRDAGELPAAQEVLPDGKILVAGTAFPATGAAFMLLRFDADGFPDPSFGDGGRVWTDLATVSTPLKGAVTEDFVAVGSSGIYDLAVLPDGRFVVAGYTYGGSSIAFALARYLPDGTLDPSFGSEGIVFTDLDPLADDVATSLVVEDDGGILAAGRSGERAVVARYHADGTPDESFGSEGVATTDEMLVVLAAAADPSGRVLVAGQSGTPGGPFDLAVGRFLPDGTLDASFGDDGGVIVTDLGPTGEWLAFATLDGDGRLVVAGTSGASFVLLRYTEAGRRDPAFGDEGVVTSGPRIGWARSVSHLPDGRLVVAGGHLNGSERDVAVCRYLPDGTLDATFGAKGVLSTDVVPVRHDEGTAASLQPDGKLVVTGTSFDPENIHPLVVLVRYDDVGS